MFQTLKLAWRSIWRQKRRTALTLVSISMGLFLIIFMSSVQEYSLQDAINTGARLQAGHITIEHADYRLSPQIALFVKNAGTLADDLRGRSETDAVKLLIAGEGVARSGAGAFGIAISGVVPGIEAASSPLAQDMVEGAYLEKDDKSKVVIGALLAERLNLALGKKLVIATNDINGDLVERLYRVKGIFKTGTDEIDGALVQMRIGSARTLFNLPEGSATQLGVVLKDLQRLSSFLPIVERALKDRTNLAAHAWQTIMPGLNGFVAIKRAGTVVMELVLMALVFFTILNTLLMSVAERKKEFATILALGAKPRDLRLQVFLESALMGGIGVLLGAGLGAMLTYYFSIYGIDLTDFLATPGVAVSGVQVELVLHTLFSERLMLTFSLLVLGATLLLSLVPISRMGRTPMADLLR